MQRENSLCQVDSHGSNLFHDFPSGYQIELRQLNLGTSMPSPAWGSPFHSLERSTGVMEHFAITKTADGFHIEGFPDAVKVLRIAGPKAQRLADLALHKVDLDFTLDCLETINTAPEEPHALRRALWHSAIVHFIKCFGQSESRFSLDPKVVYKTDTGAFEPYKYFDSLRNKNVVHDENSYMQCLPGAVLNKKGMDHKIAKIVCLSVVGETLGQENYQNLHLLTTRAREWVVAQFDELCNVITRELEPKPYEELLALEAITYTVPGANDVHKPRAAL